MSTGYLNRVIRLDFSDLSANPDTDPVWIVIRNPRLVPPSELTSNIALNPDGTPVDMNDATEAMYRTMLRLIVGWRVYDGTAPFELHPVTGEPFGDQPLLPSPATLDSVKKLPTVMINAVANEIKQAANPQ